MSKYYSACMPGFAEIAQEEIKHKLPKARGFKMLPVRNLELVQFDYSSDPKALVKIGQAEDIYYHLKTIELSGERKDLERIRKGLFKRSDVFQALSSKTAYTGKKPKAKVTFRVVAQAADVSWRLFKRQEMQKALTLSVSDMFPGWKVVEDDADLEFWIQQSEKNAIIGLRLSDKKQRHGDYKKSNIPGSLRPSIARALVMLSEPSENDVFLDPMCGAGTILIERAMAGRYKILLGGDKNKEAVESALNNFGSKHEPKKIKVWDAVKIPLEDHSVDKIVCNPPWGRKVGDHPEIKPLYKGFAKEVKRLLKPDGKVVILTSHDWLMKDQLKDQGIQIIKTFTDLEVLGHKAAIIIAALADKTE
jgi:tRNA (guanine6-N2)-methyltransferase